VATVTVAGQPRPRHFVPEEMMKKTALLVLIAILLVPVSMYAADAKTTFEAKCKMCHGANLEKKAIDTSKSDADLVKFLTTNDKHKTRVGDEATAKAIVAYIKSIKK
jgi:hypothetical protein